MRATPWLPALLRAEAEERIAEIVLGPGPFERHAGAGPFLQGFAKGGNSHFEPRRPALLRAESALRFALGDGRAQTARDNSFFCDLYRNLADLLGAAGGRDIFGFEAREHTAQVDSVRRQYRESRFRLGGNDRKALAEHAQKEPDDPEPPRFLPALFCSPPMELGVDISALDAVYMRSVPPTPANYAQRSGIGHCGANDVQLDAPHKFL